MKSLVLAFALLASVSVAAQRGASTPEERARLVSITKSLETNPLDKNLRPSREWALKWLIEVPDVSVSLCTDILGAASRSKNKYQSEIVVQLTLGQAAFVIENPVRAKDQHAAYLASAESALRAYEGIKKQKPETKWPEMDTLLEARDKGELGARVRENMKNCR